MSINFINESRPFEINSSIIEWDMRRAGIHIIKEYSLLSEKEIQYYESLPKKESDVAIGKRQIGDKDFSKRFEQGFTDAMNTFLEQNYLDMNFDVISIKKDACFVINRDIKNPYVGKHIEFVQKNKYHACVNLKPFLTKGNGYEFYFSRTNGIDVKGLSGNKDTRNKLIELHQNGILNFLEYTIDLAEKTGLDPKQMNHFLHNFVEMYKRKELDFDYYREFNIESRFRYHFLGNEMMTDRIDESMLEKIRIDFNYIHIIMPLINLIV